MRSAWRRLRGRKSRREILLDNKRALDFMAAATNQPPLDFDIPPAPQAKKIRRPVDGKAPSASEHQEQAAVISWWTRVHQKYELPEFALFAVPNGGARDAITGSLLKAEGVRSGVLDLILAKPVAPYCGLFLEMKVGYNKPSEKQKAFLDYLKSVGYVASVHWNAGSAIEAIEDYLRDVSRPTPT